MCYPRYLRYFTNIHAHNITSNAIESLIYPKPRWCSGLARRPFKPEITGSNPVRGTIQHYTSISKPNSRFRWNPCSLPHETRHCRSIIADQVRNPWWQPFILDLKPVSTEPDKHHTEYLPYPARHTRQCGNPHLFRSYQSATQSNRPTRIIETDVNINRIITPRKLLYPSNSHQKYTEICYTKQ